MFEKFAETEKKGPGTWYALGGGGYLLEHKTGRDSDCSALGEAFIGER